MRSIREAARCAVSLLVCLVVSACIPLTAVRETPADRIGLLICGALGQACCRPPVSTPPDLGPVVACNSGLGCNVQTNTCVQPCGGTGQVCCDGPETRATKWTSSGALYSPTSFDKIEMCRTGGCDIKSHRCYDCGTKDGEACCGPDAEQATSRCLDYHLECKAGKPLGALSVTGICRACGSPGKPPCHWGCDQNLEPDVQGNCNVCGGDMQVPCRRGCNPGLHLAQGLCRQCGNAGQIPCDTGCFGGLRIINGLCTACGTNGLPPCSGVCDPGWTIVNSRCQRCGGDGQPSCNGVCNYPLKTANGQCRFCGGNGQIPCDTGCNSGLVVSGGVCKPPSVPPGPICAVVNQACVPDNQPGTHCCQMPGAPEICNFGFCKACVPHGAVCAPGGTQICCSAKDGDICKLDQATGNAICDIPD